MFIWSYSFLTLVIISLDQASLTSITPSSSNSNSISIGCEEECNEWERCTNISQDFFGFEMACRPKLNLYTSHGNWSGELNVIDESGNIHLYQLENLKSITQGLQNISIDFPEYGSTSHLILNFINSETLEFTINDMKIAMIGAHFLSNCFGAIIY